MKPPTAAKKKLNSIIEAEGASREEEGEGELITKLGQNCKGEIFMYDLLLYFRSFCSWRRNTGNDTAQETRQVQGAEVGRPPDDTHSLINGRLLLILL